MVHQFKVGDRVKLLGKSFGYSAERSVVYKKYMEGEPVEIVSIKNGHINVTRTYDKRGGDSFLPRDLAPWNGLGESEEV